MKLQRTLVKGVTRNYYIYTCNSKRISLSKYKELLKMSKYESLTPIVNEIQDDNNTFEKETVIEIPTLLPPTINEIQNNNIIMNETVLEIPIVSTYIPKQKKDYEFNLENTSKSFYRFYASYVSSKVY